MSKRVRSLLVRFWERWWPQLERPLIERALSLYRQSLQSGMADELVGYDIVRTPWPRDIDFDIRDWWDLPARPFWQNRTKEHDFVWHYRNRAQKALARYLARKTAIGPNAITAIAENECRKRCLDLACDAIDRLNAESRTVEIDIN